MTYDGETKLFCGGTWISGNRILTAGHCAAAVRDWDAKEDGPAEFGYALLNDPTPRPFEIVKISDGYDLAVLEAKEIMLQYDHPIARIASKGLNLGDQVSSYNHTGRLDWSYMRGAIAGIRHGDDGKTYQVDMVAYKGASGAAIFDSDGNLQGVFSFIARSAPGEVFCVHRDIIAGWL